MLSILLLAAQTASFHEVELRNGGEVVVRHGAEPSVSLVEGDRRTTRINIAGGRLVIDRCAVRCPRGYRLRVDVVTPSLTALSVSDGGSLQAGRGFPRQANVAASVSSGGVLDIRALPVEDVTASVAHGGLIFTRPARRLAAAVAQGGAITYWGDPDVTRSIRQGGVVARGEAADEARPLADLHPRVPPIPRLPDPPHLNNR